MEVAAQFDRHPAAPIANNPTDQQYSRNLDGTRGQGIERLRV